MTVETPADYFIASLALKHASLSRPFAVTWGVHSTAALTPLAVANAVWGAVNTTVRVEIDNNITVGPVTVHGGTTASPVSAVGSDTPVIGGATGTTVPANCAVLVEKRTARGGRRGRGRMFWPGMLQTTAVDEAGVINGTRQTSLTTLFGNFLAALVTQQVPMVVLHNTGVTLPGSPDPVISLVIDPVIGSQRRRLGR